MSQEKSYYGKERDSQLEVNDLYTENSEFYQQILELFQQKPKRIYQEGQMTIIEFEDGQILPLYGGIAEIQEIAESNCSFCGKKESEVGVLGAPPDRDEPLICPDCAVRFVELFAKKGIEIKLNISSISPELANKLQQALLSLDGGES